MTDCKELCDLGLEQLLFREYDKALDYFIEAYKLDRASPEIWYNIGQCYFGKNGFEAAAEHYKEATKLRMEYSEAWAMLATCYYNMLEVNQAISCYKMAADMAKTDSFKSDCLNDMSAVYLAMGRFDIGYKYFKHRRINDTWDGTQSLVGKHLYVVGDGGLGDQIFFSRYLPWISDFNYKELVVRVQPEVYKWFKSEFIQNGTKAYITCEKPSMFDYVVSMSSLPKIFNTQLGTIPIIHQNIPELYYIRNIGLAWSGNPLHANDSKRSMPVTQINKIIDAFPDKNFYRLQKNVPYADKDLVHTRLITVNYETVDDMAKQMDDIEIDLVITVDTMTAHLACTEGYNTFIMLPYAPDWRWGLTGDTTPWYPTARLFRQDIEKSWDTVINNVIDEVRNASNS